VSSNLTLVFAQGRGRKAPPFLFISKPSVGAGEWFTNVNDLDVIFGSPHVTTHAPIHSTYWLRLYIEVKHALHTSCNPD
jgi:hypothetical protein